MAIDIELVRKRVSQFLKKPVDRLTDDALLRDLVTESLVLVDMIITLQEDYKVRFTQDKLANVKTVGDLLRLFRG